MKLDVEEIENARDKVFQEFRAGNTLHADESGLVEFHGERYNIMGADYFMADIFKMLKEDYEEETPSILQSAGVRYGKKLVEAFEDQSGQERFGGFLGLLSFLGYSKPEVEEQKVIFPSSPTAEEYRKKNQDKQTTCYMLKGMLIGASLQIGDVTNFEETRCRANGDEGCVFEIKGE
jgi:predicted hydrocarbon binding protein